MYFTGMDVASCAMDTTLLGDLAITLSWPSDRASSGLLLAQPPARAHLQ
jgi:hypothetical protein